MPVFNAGRFLEASIRSVLHQDHQHWELLVVNDGSTDDTMSVARACKDPRIRLIDQPHRGVSGARNAALKMMRGDFFCFLDADDVLPERSISSRLRCFESKEVAFVDGKVEIYDADLRDKIATWCPRSTNHRRSLVRLDGKCFFGPTWMIRNQPTIKYQFDEALTHGEELLFCLSCAHTGSYRFTNEVVLKYRKSASSAMSNLTGLARGYFIIGRRMKDLAWKPSFADRLVYAARARKIIFLSFFRSGDVLAAIKYMVTGRI